MSTKKYILVFALAGLVFSCQKENIQPNSVAATSTSDSNEAPVWRNSITTDNNGLTNLKSHGIVNEIVEPTVLRTNDDGTITDPNNDDDRNKKKKN